MEDETNNVISLFEVKQKKSDIEYIEKMYEYHDKQYLIYDDVDIELLDIED